MYRIVSYRKNIRAVSLLQTTFFGERIVNVWNYVPNDVVVFIPLEGFKRGDFFSFSQVF